MSQTTQMTCWCDTPEVLPTDYAVDVCEYCGEVVV